MRIDQLLERAARTWGPRTAIRDLERSVDWSGLRNESLELARALAGLGVGPSDRVAVVGRNRIGYAAAYFACARLSAVLVPLNARLRPAEIRTLIERSGARAILADADCAPRLDVPDGVHRVGIGAVEGWTHVQDVASGSLGPSSPDASAVAVQMYTSGTTGLPKGAMLTHGNVTAMTLAWGLEMPMGPDDRFLQVTPLFHVGAMIILMSCAMSGARMELLPEFTPGAAARALAGEGITHSLMVPAMIRWLLDDPVSDGLDFPNLRVMAYGASPMPVELMRRARRRLGCAFVQGYGLTETAGVLTVLRPEDHETDDPMRLSSAGRPTAGSEVRLVDADGEDVPLGEIGEVVARGPNVFVGYHELPEATRQAFVDGWFRTGDLATMDAEGFVRIVDRSKDMILVGGENVYPREVEDALRSHPLVADVAVIGIPHEAWGEQVLAVVVPTAEPDRDPTRELVRHARASLAVFKCPTRVQLVSELPRNAAGKVQKAKLREPYWADRDRRV